MSNTSQKNATLLVDGNEYELPIINGTLGRPVLDISALQDAGYWSYDPGFKVTAPVESKITFIDGNKGELLHRGYPIDQLAEKAEYLEVCYALLYGELPTQQQKDDFYDKVKHHAGVHEQLRKFYEGFRLTLWQPWWGWWAHYQRFIMTIWTSAMNVSVKLPPFV